MAKELFPFGANVRKPKGSGKKPKGSGKKPKASGKKPKASVGKGGKANAWQAYVRGGRR
jgi:hypothetical protein